MKSAKKIIGGIEAGGTKFVCAVGFSSEEKDQPVEVLSEVRFPTTTPEATLAQALAFFQEAVAEFGELAALGIGTFGPASVQQRRKDYGRILNTPKKGWKDAEIVSFFTEAFPEASIAFDTDVNAAALGESLQGAGKDVENFVYLTVGTGIGGGVIVDGKPLQGLLHPEIGHLLLPPFHALENGKFSQPEKITGSCPFHEHCLEGYASGTAMNQLWGCRAETLPPDHPAWELEATFLAAACQNLTAILSPQRIILGGGVMQQMHLFPMIRNKFQALIGDYWSIEEPYIIPPALGNQAGIIGSLQLAITAID